MAAEAVRESQVHVLDLDLRRGSPVGWSHRYLPICLPVCLPAMPASLPTKYIWSDKPCLTKSAKPPKACSSRSDCSTDRRTARKRREVPTRCDVLMDEVLSRRVLVSCGLDVVGTKVPNENVIN